jgi:hypothetical protein
LATNPGPFFDQLQPIIREFVSAAGSVRFQYDKSLVRVSYWVLCLSFARRLIQKMEESVPLMPVAARRLWTALNAMNTGRFTFIEVFGCEAMLFGYLEHPFLSLHATLLRDLCNVIRCSYPQDMLPSPVYGFVKSNPELPSIQLGRLVRRLCVRNLEASLLSQAIQFCEQSTVLTTRSLFLIYQCLGTFFMYGTGRGIRDIVSIFSLLAEPAVVNMDQLFSLKISAGKAKPPRPAQPPPPYFNDFANLLAGIDYHAMRWRNPAELANRTLLFAGSHLNGVATLRVSYLPDHVRDLSKTLKAMQTYRLSLSSHSGALAASLVAFAAEKESRARQAARLLELLVRRRLAPQMREMYPRDFGFPVAPEADGAAALGRIFHAMTLHITPMGLARASQLALTREFVLVFLDELDAVFRYQEAAVMDRQLVIESMLRFCQLDRTPMSPAQLKAAKNAAVIFARIVVSKPPSVNLGIALLGMSVLESLPEAHVRVALARSRNPALFAFRNFVRAWIKGAGLYTHLLTEAEYESLRKFVYATCQFKKLLNGVGRSSGVLD